MRCEQCKMAASAGAARFQQIPAGFLAVGYTCFLFNCREARSLPLSLPVFSPIFTSLYSLVFSSLPISSLGGILPCIIHEATCLFLHTTYQQPCCGALRGSHLCQPVICLHTQSNQLTPLLTNYTQFLEWPSPWHEVRCDHRVLQKRHRRRE